MNCDKTSKKGEEMSEIKHSVLMLTYNQERLLPLALESVLKQPVLPYEVIISDDCSTDGTWNVICEYYNRYSTIIKPFRNEINLGVFGNFNRAKTLPKGDIISCLAGDDFYKSGIFEAFNHEIEQQNVDPQKDKFIVICNAIDLYSDGKEVIYDNYRFRNSNLFKLKLRYALNFRDTGFSAATWEKISPLREDLGYNADWLYCIDQIEQTEHFYFINEAYPVYRIGIGVAAKTKLQTMLKSRIDTVLFIKRKYSEVLDYSDKRYLQKELTYNKYLYNKSIVNLFIALYYLFINWNNFPFRNVWINEVKTVIFSAGGEVLRKIGLRKKE